MRPSACSRRASPTSGSASRSPRTRRPTLLVEVYRLAGLPDLGDAARIRATAERQVAISRALTAVRGVAGNAALMLHAEGAPREEVLAYLERRLLSTPERAAKRLEFISHPLWRTYVFVYFEGERLLRRWLEMVPAADQPARFGRLLAEQLTPSAIVAEIGADGGEVGGPIGAGAAGRSVSPPPTSAARDPRRHRPSRRTPARRRSGSSPGRPGARSQGRRRRRARSGRRAGRRPPRRRRRR